MDLKAILKRKVSHMKGIKLEFTFWFTVLKSYRVVEKKVDQEQQKKELEDIEDKYFLKYYNELKNTKQDSNCSYNRIPKFFFKLPKEDDLLQQKFREEARSIFLQRRSRALLDNNELKVFMNV